jgi:WD40 repeat protein
VGTSPGLAWDQYRQDWVAGAPVPPALRGAFAEEPLWVDLSDVRLGRHRPRIPTDRVADVVAPIRGVPKDTLIGEHLRQHRRTMRLARGAVAVLATLTALALVASFIAVGQRNSARTQARIATSRELAALASSNLTTHLDVAQLLAVAAYRMDHNTQTEAAVWQAVAASPHLVRFLQAGDTVTALAGSADGNVVAAGTASGHIVLFDVGTGHRSDVAASHSQIADVAVSADGRTVAATNDSAVLLWRVGASSVKRVGGVRSPSSVAVSPSGRFIASLGAAGTSAASVRIWDARSGNGLSAGVSAGFIRAAFPRESSPVLITGTGDWERLSPGDLHVTSGFNGLETPAGDFRFGSSSNGRYAGYVKFGGVVAWPTTSAAASDIGNNIVTGRTPDAPSSDLEISPDGTRGAAVESGTIYVTELATDSGTPRSGSADTVQLAGNGNTSMVHFLGDDNRLVSSSGSSVALWDLRQISRLSRPTGVQVPPVGSAGYPPTLVSTVSGRLLGVVGGTLGSAQVYRTGPRLTLASRPNNPSGEWAAPLSRGDQLLLTGHSANGSFAVADSGGQILRSWSGIGGQFWPLSVRMLPGGERFAAVDQTGAVRVYDLHSGAVRQIAAGTKFTVRPEQADISPDGSGAVISEWYGSVTRPFSSIRVVYVDLRTGASRLVGTTGADGVLFTRDGLIVQRAGGALEVWDVTGRKLLRTLPGAGGVAAPLAASPDGALLARLHGDGTVSVTDLVTGDVLVTFSLPAPTDSTTADPWDATAMIFTPDGKDLLTATSGGELNRWTIGGLSLVSAACATVGRDLTAAEWRQYVHTSPPADLSCGSGPAR